MLFERRIGVRFLKCMEFPILQIAQPRREPLSDEGKQRKDVIAGSARISKVFPDIEGGFMIEKTIKDVRGFALCRADRQNAEIAILIGEVTIEL